MPGTGCKIRSLNIYYNVMCHLFCIKCILFYAFFLSLHTEKEKLSGHKTIINVGHTFYLLRFDILKTLGITQFAK